jgi:RNA recognition motif-containing protein
MPTQTVRESEDDRRLYVGGLDYGVGERELRDAFITHVPVEAIKLITDKTTGRSMGYAFLTLKTLADVDKAIAECQELVLRGRKIRVGRANARARPMENYRSTARQKY